LFAKARRITQNIELTFEDINNNKNKKDRDFVCITNEWPGLSVRFKYGRSGVR